MGMSTFNLWPLDFEFRIWKMNFELWALSLVLQFGMFRLWLEFFWTLFELWDFVWSCLDFVNGGQSNFRLYLSHFDFVCTFFKNCLVFVWTLDFVWSHLNRVNIKHINFAYVKFHLEISIELSLNSFRLPEF